MNRNTRPTPILVDNSLNIAFAIKYFIYFMFGVSGFVVSVPSITEFAGEVVATLTTAIVGVAALISSVCAYLSHKSLKYQKVEFYSTIVLISFVLVYDGSIIALAFAGDDGRINLAIIATALLVMPIWRLRYLYRNHK